MRFRYDIFFLFTLFFLNLFSVFPHESAEILSVPFFKQGKDAPWADEKLGSKSELTIRTHGCALTSISMVISFYSGENITPPYMNSWLVKNNGFEDAYEGKKYLGKVKLHWPSLCSFGSSYVYTRMDWKAGPADTVLIKYYLDNGIPVIAEVSYKKAPHYIVLTGYDSDGFFMNDPEFPDEHRFNKIYNISDKWGSGPSRNINGIRILYQQNYLKAE